MELGMCTPFAWDWKTNKLKCANNYFLWNWRMFFVYLSIYTVLLLGQFFKKNIGSRNGIVDVCPEEDEAEETINAMLFIIDGVFLAIIFAIEAVGYLINKSRNEIVTWFNCLVKLNRKLSRKFQPICL